MTHNDYMQIAEIVASSSYCARAKVGAIIERDGNIIAIGYNGTPSGWENKCEDENGITKYEVLHAESNAIAKCARTGVSSNGGTMYVTHMPCLDCAKLIIQAGIEAVYYRNEYRMITGIDVLETHGIVCEKI
jgi:dCMP deaminase